MKKAISPDLQREIERSLAQEARKASQRLERLLQQRGATRNVGKLEALICSAASRKIAIQEVLYDARRMSRRTQYTKDVNE